MSTEKHVLLQDR